MEFHLFLNSHTKVDYKDKWEICEKCSMKYEKHDRPVEIFDYVYTLEHG